MSWEYVTSSGLLLELALNSTDALWRRRDVCNYTIWLIQSEC
jgi:hypothetical protein